MAEKRALKDLDPTARKAEEAWAEEKTWPLFKVVLTGPEIEYKARPGINLNDDGDPEPWVAPARCTCYVQAINEEIAKARALSDNLDLGVDTVESVEEVPK